MNLEFAKTEDLIEELMKRATTAIILLDGLPSRHAKENETAQIVAYQGSEDVMRLLVLQMILAQKTGNLIGRPITEKERE